MSPPEPDQAPASPLLGSIGLAMSGGGFRASAFHLGALDYLEHLGRLSSVRVLSTVSGGTFTGARFTLSLVRRQKFEDFFRIFYGELRDVDLVAAGLDELGRRASKVPSGRRDLIVALAEVYSETFFAHEGGAWTFAEILDAELPIETVVFNATEFRTGIAFRFQRSPKGKIGNGNIEVPRDAAGLIRVADIVAASSCFPGGFEPLAFPQDFGWPDGKVPAALAAEPFANPVPLMDGGVYDNQGTESLLLADRREGCELGQVIISDVDPKSDDLFPFPSQEGVGLLGGLSLRTVAFMSWALMVACAVTVASLAAELWRDGLRWPWGLFTRLLPMLLALAVACGLWVVRRELLRRALELVPQVGRRAWKDFRRITVDQLVDMAWLRLRSVVSLTASIFMKRIRALGYKQLYQDEKYKLRRVSNLVYHLQSSEPFATTLAGHVDPPSPALRRVADAAATMPTALWFQPETPWQLPCLVAAGQATLCYNLMKQVVRVHGAEPARLSPDLRALWDRLVADWQTFRGDPYGLLRNRELGELSEPPRR
jgi:predicted acylesterase/phospholipase RssA